SDVCSSDLNGLHADRHDGPGGKDVPAGARAEAALGRRPLRPGCPAAVRRPEGRAGRAPRAFPRRTARRTGGAAPRRSCAQHAGRTARRGRGRSGRTARAGARRGRDMSDVAVSLRWRGSGLVMDATTPESLRVSLDSKRIEGASPPQLLLIALAGCTSIDIIDIAAKMRVDLDSLEVEIEGDRAPEPPRRYTAIRATYRVGGV